MNARNGWVGAALYLSNSLMQASGRERCQWPGARERERERGCQVMMQQFVSMRCQERKVRQLQWNQPVGTPTYCTAQCKYSKCTFNGEAQNEICSDLIWFNLFVYLPIWWHQRVWTVASQFHLLS